MEWILVSALAAVVVLPVVVLGSAAFLATSSLRRANRLHPGAATAPAPVWWLWSPGSAAMLHRRLRAACQLAGPTAASAKRRRLGRRPGAATDSIGQLAGEILHEAVVLDRQLVTTGRSTRGLTRSQALAALDQQVRAIEDAARRVNHLALRRAELARGPVEGSLSLDQRIAALEEAMGELAPRPPTP